MSVVIWSFPRNGPLGRPQEEEAPLWFALCCPSSLHLLHALLTTPPHWHPWKHGWGLLWETGTATRYSVCIVSRLSRGGGCPCFQKKALNLPAGSQGSRQWSTSESVAERWLFSVISGCRQEDSLPGSSPQSLHLKDEAPPLHSDELWLY